MKDREPMKKLFLTAACLVAILTSDPALCVGRQHSIPPPPQPRQSPNAPTNQNVPQGLEGRPASTDTTRVSPNVQNEQELRGNIQQMYQLALELKEEADKSNSNIVLDVSLVKRAQEIEKLAKRIKNQAKQ
jgi:hypothetical protein